MSFTNLKKAANQEFLRHFRFYVILFLPYLILQSINELLANSISNQLTTLFVRNGQMIQDGLNQHQNPFTTGLASGMAVVNQYFSQNQFAISLSHLISFIGAVALSGIAFQALAVMRRESDYTRPLDKSTAIFGNRMVWGVVGVLLLQTILTALWSILFIIPGIVKSLSYSQAVYIYRDAYVNDHPISPLAAITLSRKLMNGYKWQLCWLELSFIGWWILLSIATTMTIIPILGIYVFPYFQLTMLNYYNQLLVSQADRF